LTDNGRCIEPSISFKIQPTHHLQYFKFTGKLISISIIEGTHVQAHLVPYLLNHVLQIPLVLTDVEPVCNRLYLSLSSILENTVDDLDIFFEVTYNYYEKFQTDQLKQGILDIVVTDENKAEHVDLNVNNRLNFQAKAQIKNFLADFYFLIPPDEVQIFSPQELDLINCGIPDVDIADMKANTRFEHPYSINHPVIVNLFEVLTEFDQETHAKFLVFLTASSAVSVGGFMMLVQTTRPIAISFHSNFRSLPVSHACFNVLQLSSYPTKEMLRDKFFLAILYCETFE
jgi:E3 ubiquitin-protein ligase HUWE1